MYYVETRLEKKWKHLKRINGQKDNGETRTKRNNNNVTHPRPEQAMKYDTFQCRPWSRLRDWDKSVGSH